MSENEKLVVSENTNKTAESAPSVVVEKSDEAAKKRDYNNDNSIFVGAKPFMNYVTGVVMQFTTKNASEVIVKARGKFISRAADIVEVVSKRFLEGQIAIKDIAIDSEEFENKEGKQVRVSTIEITLNKI